MLLFQGTTHYLIVISVWVVVKHRKPLGGYRALSVRAGG